MKVLVCGSRDWTDRDSIEARISDLPPDAVVIQGEARGADIMARSAAWRRGHHVVAVKAHWEHHGRSAGHKRNAVMLDLGPDLVVAFQRDGSSGTQGTIDEARKRGIPVEVHTA